MTFRRGSLVLCCVAPLAALAVVGWTWAASQQVAVVLKRNGEQARIDVSDGRVRAWFLDDARDVRPPDGIALERLRTPSTNASNPASWWAPTLILLQVPPGQTSLPSPAAFPRPRVNAGCGGLQVIVADPARVWASPSGAPLVPRRSFAIYVPVWLAVLAPAGGLAVAVGFAVRRRRNRPRPGVCRRCGYDLRATPDQCPECGASGGAA